MDTTMLLKLSECQNHRRRLDTGTVAGLGVTEHCISESMKDMRKVARSKSWGRHTAHPLGYGDHVECSIHVKLSYNFFMKMAKGSAN